MADLSKYYRVNETGDTDLVVAWAGPGRYDASFRQDENGCFWLIYPDGEGVFFETTEEMLDSFFGQIPAGQGTIEIYQAGSRVNDS